MTPEETKTSDNRTEIRRLRRLVREIGELAQHASLTGSLQGGASSAARRYNTIIQRLEELGAVSPGLFQPLAADEAANFDEIGVESKLVAGYLEEEEEEERAGKGQHGGPNVIIGSLNGMQSLEELKDLGRIIRENLPEWMREKARERHEGEREEPRAETAGRAASLSEVESRLAEVGARLQAVAEQLRRDSLTSEERADLAEQLSRLGQEQARLAREHARLRETTA